jgi:EPS-associated MarR family transcriptional regulator
MRLLVAKPEISQRELAEQLGISLGGLNYCLRALADKGLVKMQNFTENPNKLGYVYLLTPKGMAAKAQLAGGFLKRKMAEYEALKAEIEAISSEMASSRIPQLHQ